MFITTNKKAFWDAIGGKRKKKMANAVERRTGKQNNDVSAGGILRYYLMLLCDSYRTYLGASRIQKEKTVIAHSCHTIVMCSTCRMNMLSLSLSVCVCVCMYVCVCVLLEEEVLSS